MEKQSEGMNVADRYRLGQENIDRMKRETELIASTVLGVVSVDPLFFPHVDLEWTSRGNRVFESPEFKWIITPKRPENRANIECWHKQKIGRGSSDALVYTHCASPHFPSIGRIHLAHRARVFLLESVLEQSIHIADTLKPILDAADYRF